MGDEGGSPPTNDINVNAHNAKIGKDSLSRGASLDER